MFLYPEDRFVQEITSPILICLAWDFHAIALTLSSTFFRISEITDRDRRRISSPAAIKCLDVIITFSSTLITQNGKTAINDYKCLRNIFTSSKNLISMQKVKERQEYRKIIRTDLP